MQSLKFTYTIVMIAGCFRPSSWMSPFKNTIYIIYRLYIISMLYTFTMLQLMDIVLNVDNADDFTSNLNMMLTTSAACYKIFIMWISYENVATLINSLTEEPFKPLDSDEIKICRHFDKIIR